MEIRSCENCGAVSDTSILKIISEKKIKDGDVYIYPQSKQEAEKMLKPYKDETRDRSGKKMPFVDYYDFCQFVCPVCGKTNQFYS